MSRLYEKLIVWQQAHELCKFTYVISHSFPSDERFGLTSQIRRSAYSVPMNIAEGNGRRSRREKARFFEIALSSLEELHYQFKLAQDLQYCTNETLVQANRHIESVSKLLTKLRSRFLTS